MSQFEAVNARYRIDAASNGAGVCIGGGFAVIERSDTTGLNPGLMVVVVLGPANAVVTQALWAAGLRPVRGQRHGSVWAFPGATVPR